MAMASSSSLSLFPLLLLLLLLHISFSVISSSSSIISRRVSGERKVGGRMEIEDVESNDEVQDLGRFCVDRYNRGMRESGSPPLSFSRVEAGEKQVVSGFKYYLRIATTEVDDRRITRAVMMFDAVVVVKPWMRARELVSFTPSPGYSRE